MPGFTKTLTELEETAIERLGFCFSRVFMLKSFRGRNIAQRQDREIRQKLKYTLDVIQRILKIPLSDYRVNCGLIRVKYKPFRLKMN